MIVRVQWIEQYILLQPIDIILGSTHYFNILLLLSSLILHVLRSQNCGPPLTTGN